MTTNSDDAPNQMDGFCECGCGQRAPIAKESSRKFGWVRGAPMRFCRGHNNAGRGIKRERWRVEDRGFSSPCWVWALQIGPTGYGRVKRYGAIFTAHRVVYEDLVGPIPPGLDLDHLCRVRSCVNPAHLEPVSRAENLRRGIRTKLTRADVAAIRQSADSAKALAARYGVSERRIYQVR